MYGVSMYLCMHVHVDMWVSGGRGQEMKGGLGVGGGQEVRGEGGREEVGGERFNLS